MAEYNLADKEQYSRALRYFTTLAQAGRIVEITKKKESRIASIPQVGYAHIIIRIYASDQGLTEEEAKIDFKRLSKDVFAYKRNNAIYLRHITDVDTAKLTTAIDRFRNHASTLGIYLPAPHENEKLAAAEEYLDRHGVKEYL